MVRIGIFGAGGVGGYFGARMGAAGHPVAFIARGAHGAALPRDGLLVLSPLGDLHLRDVEVSDDPAKVAPCDLVLLCVKLWDTAAAAEQLPNLLGESGVVVSLQNGVDAEPLLVDRLGKERVLGGVCHIASAIEAPGVIRHTGTMAKITLGELNGDISDRVNAFINAFREAGVEAVASGTIEVEMWRKFIFLAPFATMTCLVRGPIGKVREDAAALSRLRRLIEEAVEVGRARGVDLPSDSAAATLAFAEGLPAEMKSSMLVDLERGNRLELDWLIGTVVRLGEASGVDVRHSRAALEELAPFAQGAARK